MASIASRVLRTVLEEDGSVEHALRGVLAAFRLVSRVARAWPWGHTATAASAWFVATRTSLSASTGTLVVPKAALSYLPGWKSLLNLRCRLTIKDCLRQNKNYIRFGVKNCLASQRGGVSRCASDRAWRRYGGL